MGPEGPKPRELKTKRSRTCKGTEVWEKPRCPGVLLLHYCKNRWGKVGKVSYFIPDAGQAVGTGRGEVTERH